MSDKPKRIKSNPVLESVTTANGVLIQDRSHGGVIQIWINEAPSIVFKQDNFKRFQNWKWTKNAKRFQVEVVFVYETEKGEPVLEIMELEYDNSETCNAATSILAKYK